MPKEEESKDTAALDRADGTKPQVHGLIGVVIKRVSFCYTLILDLKILVQISFLFLIISNSLCLCYSFLLCFKCILYCFCP